MNLGSNDLIARLLGEWAVGLNVYSVMFRVALSLLLAAIIGCERSSKRHSAGLRTFILVTIAATIAMIVDLSLISYADVKFAVLSPAIIIGAAMISGNSILFTAKSQIRGLTTSAGLWTSGLIGLCAGAGLYTYTLVAFAALITSLSVFPSIEKYLKDRSNHFEVHLELKNRSDLTEFVTTVRKLGLRIDDIESNPAYLNSGLSVYSVSLTIFSGELKKYKTHAEIVQALSTLDYISYIEEMS